MSWLKTPAVFLEHLPRKKIPLLMRCPCSQWTTAIALLEVIRPASKEEVLPWEHRHVSVILLDEWDNSMGRPRIIVQSANKPEGAGGVTPDAPLP
eukprot:5131368-Ditylum_brightwellii.AAC.1